MANYYGKWRSSPFKVKNRQDFDELLANCSSEGVIEVSERGDGSIVLLSEAAFPRIVDDNGDDAGDFFDEIAKHLVPGEVAAFIEIGSEKFRFLGCVCVCVYSTGRVLTMTEFDLFKIIANPNLFDSVNKMKAAYNDDTVPLITY